MHGFKRIRGPQVCREIGCETNRGRRTLLGVEVLTEHELLGRVAAGERDALGVLYERHVRAVYRYALVELRSREDAEDATHEVFLTLDAKARNILLPGESVLPWLLVTCRNHCRNRQRARARELARRSDVDPGADFEPALSVESAEQAAEQRALHRAIQAALAELSEDDRKLFELCVEGDASYAAAAESLGLSHGGVRNRLSRLRGRVRTSIEKNQGVNT